MVTDLNLPHLALTISVCTEKYPSMGRLAGQGAGGAFTTILGHRLSIDNQNDFARVAVFFHIVVRRRRLGERKG